MNTDIQVSSDSSFPSWSLFDFRLKPNTVKYYLQDGHRIYAYALIMEVADNVGHFLQSLEVEESYQRKGIGRKLLRFLCQKYKSIWFEPRNASHNFYLKEGAKPFATHSNGWLFAINDRLPTENWKLFCGDEPFGRPPKDDFVYDPEDWDVDFLSGLE